MATHSSPPKEVWQPWHVLYKHLALPPSFDCARSDWWRIFAFLNFLFNFTALHASRMTAKFIRTMELFWKPEQCIFIFFKLINNFHPDQISFLKALVFYNSWENPSPLYCILAAACLQLHKRYYLPSMDALAKLQELVINLFGYFCSSKEMVALAADFEFPAQQIIGAYLVCLVQNECWTPTQLVICMLKSFSFPVLPFLLSTYPNMLPIIFIPFLWRVSLAYFNCWQLF